LPPSIAKFGTKASVNGVYMLRRGDPASFEGALGEYD
jgi:hypothetical protein